MNATKLVLWITTLVLTILEVYAIANDSRYKWDFIFVMLVLWAVYFLRDKIHLHPLHYGLLSVFLLLHFLGMFDLYQTYPLGLEYDHWVHGYFGFVAAVLIVFRGYHFYKLYSPVFIIVATLVVILGFSAFHEIFEYAGAMLLGEGEGVLFVGAGDIDEWDTQKDMVNNVIGGLLGLACYYLFAFLFPGKGTTLRPAWSQ